ncbi:hypothetical protein [Haloarcula nitratireducens]|uniref:HEAT repeat domain-containing protein n=1 Tax=Haloarcula nitratireducens TaxID=2487749 RepID=A0AAW4PFS4_9EURY|nr:hypothetical protein [Halomicroarcula nitratireducens]MBX0296708.1 hypothetical protein [Halomicroarcula nitratireducens]
MEQTPEAFAAALSSGDTARVNQAIDEVKELDPADRAALFEDCLDRCQDLFENGDGYQRQSVVRFEAALYPRLELQTVGMEATDEALPGEWTLEDAAWQRMRLFGCYSMALMDDDGRVRQAGIKALEQLAVTLDMIEAEDDLQIIADELARYAEHHEGTSSKQKHFDQAYENVAVHAERSGSLVPEGLREALDQDESSD